MTNPLLDDWTTPFGIAPFDRISDEDFAPAFEALGRKNPVIEPKPVEGVLFKGLARYDKQHPVARVPREKFPCQDRKSVV